MRQRDASLARPAVIAHRGASRDAPENTLAAFRLAIESGADMIETDCRLSRDGQVVLIHDASLARTTGRDGMAADFDAADLARFDAGYGFVDALGGHPYRGQGIGVPTLDDLLTLCDDLGSEIALNLELKAPPGNGGMAVQRLAGALMARVATAQAARQVIVSSFDLGAIDHVKAIDPSMDTAHICQPGADLRRAAAVALERRHEALHPHASSLPRSDGGSLVRHAHDQGLKIRVWTVNDAETWGWLWEAGADGVITDDPAGLRRLLDGRY